MTRELSIRNLLLALALIAMGVRATAPPGYMFAPSSGGLTVTLCGGETMHVDFGKSGAPGQPIEHAPCLFAAAAQAAPTPIAVAPTPISITAIYSPYAALQAHTGQGLAAPPPPSTGPPQHA